MKTMIVFDETGKVWSALAGDVPGTASVLVADVPEGYTVIGVDIEASEPMLQKNPPTLEERIAELEATNAALLGEE